MKKLAILFSAFAIVACGGDKNGTPKCTADCNSQVPGDALCVTYNSQQFTGGTVSCNMATCAVDTTNCTGIAGKNEFETCTGTGQGDCNADLACREGVTPGTNVCLTACDSEAATDPCGASRECTQWSETTGDGICLMADATRDGACLENYRLCATGAGDCGTAGFDDEGNNIFRCKIECDQNDIGGTGSCGSEKCLASGIISGVDPEKLCSTPGDVGVCTDGSSCYEGWTDDKIRCANQIAFCGTEQPILGAFDNASITTHVTAYPCNQIDDHAMCEIIADGNTIDGDEADAQCIDISQTGFDGV
ncbi:MAG: hypothetical protein V3T05_14495, partial [Myxococcota bacterium]